MLTVGLKAMAPPHGHEPICMLYHETGERRPNAVVMIMESAKKIWFAVEDKTTDGLRFRLVQTTTGNRYIEFKEEDVARVMSEFGSSDPDFVLPLLRRIGKFGVKEKIWNADIIKFAISFIRGIRPRDQRSAMCGFHLMTVHAAIIAHYGRIELARFLQNNEEEEDAQRAVSGSLRMLISLVEAFDQQQKRSEQKFAVPNGRRLARTSKTPIRSADRATETVDPSDISRRHRATFSNTREKDQTRIEDKRPAGVDIKTSDGLKLQIFRTRYYAYVNVDEQDAIRVMEKYGSSDPDFVIPLIRQIAKLGIKVIHFDPEIIKHALSFVRGMRPGDEIEALLGYHLAAVDQALNFNFGRVNEARFMQYNVEERNADRAINWSARTSIALEKAFHRHQAEREQKLTVRPVMAANGHSTKPKRAIKNVNTLMNGVERHGEVLLSENEGGE